MTPSERHFENQLLGVSRPKRLKITAVSFEIYARISELALQSWYSGRSLVIQYKRAWHRWSKSDKVEAEWKRYLWLSVSLWSISLASSSVNCIYRLKSSCETCSIKHVNNKKIGQLQKIYGTTCRPQVKLSCSTYSTRCDFSTQLQTGWSRLRFKPCALFTISSMWLIFHRYGVGGCIRRSEVYIDTWSCLILSTQSDAFIGFSSDFLLLSPSAIKQDITWQKSLGKVNIFQMLFRIPTFNNLV